MIKIDLNKPNADAEWLIELYSQYVEGNIEEAKNKYNNLIRLVDLETKLSLIYHTPFENQAAKVYFNLDKTHKLVELVEPENLNVILKKIKKDMDFMLLIKTMTT